MPCTAVCYTYTSNKCKVEWRAKLQDRGESPGERERSGEKRL